MKTLIVCPVLDCPWTLDATPAVPLEALASVFGLGTMAATAAYEHAHVVERTLNSHLRGHSVVDFARTIGRLRQERDEALAALAVVAS